MKYAAVLDIGSSKVVSICASRVGNDGMAVHGAGVCAYAGYRAGEFHDQQDLMRAIQESIAQMQRECTFRIREIAISVPAPFTKLYIGSGEISLSSKPKRITDADIDMLISTSLPKEQFEGYSLMHSTPFAYEADGMRMAELPVEVSADTVTADVSHYYADDVFLEIVYEALNEMGISSICVSAALCEALMLIPEKDRQSPAILLDIGYTHTDICLVQNAAVLAQRTIEAGGLHFASDLAYGLEVSLSVAELVKRRYVFGLDYQDSHELLRTPEGTRSVERAYVQYILEERAKELCYLIYDAMLDMGVSEDRLPPVYLTGGGMSMMRGGREYMQHMLSLRVILDMPWMPRMNSPVYASAYGALEFVLHTGNEDSLTHQVEISVLRRLRNFFVK